MKARGLYVALRFRIVLVWVAFSLAVVMFVGCTSTPDFDNRSLPERLNGNYFHTAELAFENGEKKKAEKVLRMALQANPLDARAHYMLGCVLISQGVEEQAMVAFQRAARIDPTYNEALHNLGTLLVRRGEAIPAAEVLEAVVKNDPDYIPPYNSLGKAYFQAGLPELSAAAYREALQRDPANSIARHNLGLLLAASDPAPEKPPELKQGPESKNDPQDPKKTEEKQEKQPEPPPKPPPPKKASPSKTPAMTPDALRKLLRPLPHLTVEEYAGVLAVTGWTRGARERGILDRILARWPDVLDLTGADTGDPQRMLEVDAVLFVVTGNDIESVGFNFLRLINLSFTYFNNTTDFVGDLLGLAAPGTTGPKINLPSSGSLTVASVDYDVSIANAIQDTVSVLARPHLTTLNGTPASFHAGGEWIFRVSGIETGNIKPYPFGTSLFVTPTLLRTRDENGALRVHLDVEAQRTSVLEILTAQAADEDIVFDKLSVKSQAVLNLGQTLILSGLNQKESRLADTGVPVIKDIPVVKYLFSQKTTVETNTAVIILLTPRDPAFNDMQNRKALKAFVKMRRAFVKASNGTKKDWRRFRKRYPNWQDLAPNRFASHFFLLESSDLYRHVSHEELIDEDLDLHLLTPPEDDNDEESESQENNGENGDDAVPVNPVSA